MRPEFRWGLAAAAALALGVACAEPYARLAAPFYAMVDRRITLHRPWAITSIDVRPGKTPLTAELQLRADVFRYQGAPNRAAQVIGRVQVGEVIETPVVFWTLLLMLPAASLRQRVIRLVLGIPIFFALEAVTTSAQLILPMAQASAILAGGPQLVTPWDRWSRFLEGGGQFVLAAGFAILVASMTQRISGSPKAAIPQDASRQDMPASAGRRRMILKR